MKTLYKSLFVLLLGAAFLLSAREQSADLLRASAEKGDAVSQLKLADEFFFGKNGRRINPSLAAYWYRKSALQGNAQAQHNLGACCEFGWGTRRSLIAAFDWYAKAAGQNLERAVLRHAELLYAGIPDEDDGQHKIPGIAPDPVRAGNILRRLTASPAAWKTLAGLLLKDNKNLAQNAAEIRILLEKAVKALPKDADTLLMLATVLEYGIGGAPDQKRAADLLEKTAAARHPEGMVRYGLVLENAYGRKQNIPQALALYRSSAAAGSPRGMFELAGHLKSGFYVPQDLAGAFRLLGEASAKGYVPAFAALGDCFKEGYGTEKSLEKAFDHYMRGARLSDPAAQVRAGECYRDGLGVPADPAGAAYWFQQAAAGGNPAGMRCFAVALLTGYGVKKDTSAGTQWLRRAAEMGDRDAEQLLIKWSN